MIITVSAVILIIIQHVFKCKVSWMSSLMCVFVVAGSVAWTRWAVCITWII